MNIQAAVMEAIGAPLIIETLALDPPRADEVLIEIKATGLCHTDIVVRDGGIPVPSAPCILGHEGAGMVVAIGGAVTNVSVGDAVAITFASCGDCAPCREHRPAYCDNFVALNFLGRRMDGSTTHHHADGGEINACFFGQSSFASHVVTKGRNVVRLPAGFPVELAGPLGCGLQTGAGAVLNLLQPNAGSSIAVFGAGAVGCAAIMAARVAECATVIAIDTHAGRLDLAKELGATHVFNPRDGDPVAGIQEITGGGVDFAIDASGVVAVALQCIACLTTQGKAALVGVYSMDGVLQLPIGLLLSGRSVCTTTEGDSDPEVFIPRLIALHLEGRFPFEKMIKFYDFADINEAIADSKAGAAIKPIIRMS